MRLSYFGTDGIRGRVGSATMDPEFILKLGWAAGTVLTRYFTRPVAVIGKDTRLSGYLLESVLEAGLTSAGVDVMMLGPIPTPAVSYLTKALRAQAGVVISASHNPYYDNGIKFFTQQGKKFPDQWEQEIEELLKQKMRIKASSIGKAVRVEDANGRYIEFCKHSVFDFNANLSSKIVLDCANGAAYKVAPAVLQELGAEVITIANRPDGMNINQHCGSTNPAMLAKTVLQEQADLGIALDGDGDRLIMVDHLGQTVDGDELLYILAISGGLNTSSDSALGARRGAASSAALIGDVGGVDCGARDIVSDGCGDKMVQATQAARKSHETCKSCDTREDQVPDAAVGVVGTVMSNLGLEVSLRRLGIAFARSAVGDRYVAEMLHEKGWWLGGEPSGHLLNLHVCATGDGIINALQILKIIESTGSNLHKLKLNMVKYPQVLLNVACQEPGRVRECAAVQAQVAQYERELGQDGGRIVLRASGTEPLVRVMVEGKDSNLVTQMAENLAELVQRELG